MARKASGLRDALNTLLRLIEPVAMERDVEATIVCRRFEGGTAITLYTPDGVHTFSVSDEDYLADMTPRTRQAWELRRRERS